MRRQRRRRLIGACGERIVIRQFSVTIAIGGTVKIRTPRLAYAGDRSAFAASVAIAAAAAAGTHCDCGRHRARRVKTRKTRADDERR